MKRKHAESRGAEEANELQDFSTIQNSNKFSSHGQKKISENGQRFIVKDKCEVPVVVRGALTNWPSLNWGEEGWLKVLGDQEIEVLALFTLNNTYFNS